MQERSQEMELHFLPKKKEQNEGTIFDDNYDDDDDDADADADADDDNDTDDNDDRPLLR